MKGRLRHRLRVRRPLRHRLTLRGRLTLVYGCLFLVAGVMVLGVTYALVSQRFDERGDQVTHVQGDAAAPGQVPGGQSTFGSAPEPAGDRVVRSAQDDALAALFTQGAIALGAVGAVSTVLGWLIAGRVLQPLHQVTDTARRISEAPAADRGLHERIALDGPRDEIKELADTFDVMLARLDHAFDGQRRFIANASHELRTPLSLNKALLEVAVRGAEASPEMRQLGGTLLDINARHERLIDGLLLLARSEAEVAEHAYVDLADMVEHVVSQVGFARSGPAAVEVTAEAGEAPTTGNPVLLERIVQNLVENGVRHNVPPGSGETGWVRVVSATTDDGRAMLEVSNSGAQIAPYDIPTLFEPFRRLGADRLSGTPGTGLGLSIVRAVARAHGGDVEAEPRAGGGLVVTVTLPGAEDAVVDGTAPAAAGRTTVGPRFPGDASGRGRGPAESVATSR